MGPCLLGAGGAGRRADHSARPVMVARGQHGGTGADPDDRDVHRRARRQRVHGHRDVRAHRRRAGDRLDRHDPRRGHDGPLPGPPHGVGAGDPRLRTGRRAVAAPAGRVRQPRPAHTAGRDPRGVGGHRRRRGRRRGGHSRSRQNH